MFIFADEMSLLDNIEKSRVDVRAFGEMSGELEIVYRSEKTTFELFSCISKPRRIFISAGRNIVDLHEVYPRLWFIPEVHKVTPVYAITHMGDNLQTFYIGLDLDVRSPYECVRVLCSIISLMKVIGDKVVSIYGGCSEYKFVASLTLNRMFDSLENESAFFLLVYILGRPVEKEEWKKCLSRFRELLDKIKK